MKKLMLILSFVGVLFSSHAHSPTSFYCEASAILKMDFFGEINQGKLKSDLNVIIEGSLFVVENQNVATFTLNKNKDDGSISLAFKTFEKENKYWIDLDTVKGIGNVKTDYRGITLDDDVYCRFN
ncbi:hypothetical protein N9N67_06530 [Bacteriovoracaceae bacterium]|nr:hypothetical protein [Bacteriovoracaceae bacterium]